MANKNTRLDVLRILIKSKSFNGQDELLKELEKEGFKVTQPTLSRDLRELKASKVYDSDGRYAYTLPVEGKVNRVRSKTPRARLTQSFGFLSVDFAGNLAVVKTLNGYANSLAAEIDQHDVPGVLGSLAGDDTILIVLRDAADKKEVLNLLQGIIPRMGK